MPFTPTNYRQGDPRWGNMKLLPSPLTMKGQGCVTTLSARIASNVLQKDITPGQMCKEAQIRKGYTTGGLFLWACLENYVRRLGGTVKYLGTQAISPALKKQAKYIMRVVYIGQYRHFVGTKGSDMCFDPLDAMIKKYPKTWKLTGEYRYFK